MTIDGECVKCEAHTILNDDKISCSKPTTCTDR